MDDLLIRAFDTGDSVEALTDLLHRAYARLADMGLRFLATHQDTATTAARIAGGECSLAVVGEQIAGTITFHDAEHTGGSSWYDRPDVASFQMFAVEPALQGRGIGRALVETAERRAAETGAAELALDTAIPATHLIEMYRRWGYREVEQVRWPPVNYPSVVLSKPVGLERRSAG